MRVVFSLVLIALAGCAFAAPPSISEEFSAVVDILQVDYQVGGNVTSYAMKIYEAPSLNLEAEHIETSQFGESVTVTNYKTKTTTSYVDSLKYCDVESTNNEQGNGIFSFLAQSKKLLTQDTFGINTDVWVYTQSKDFSISYSIAADNTPIQVVLTMGEQGTVGFIYNFKEFTAGTPDASYFAIPAYCNQEDSPFARTTPARSAHHNAMKVIRNARN